MHIIFEKQDSDSSLYRIEVQKNQSGKFIWKAAVSVFVFLHLFMPRATEAAGLFDFLKSSFSGYVKPAIAADGAYSIDSYGSLQDMPVLSARPLESDAVGGSEIEIVDGSTIALKKGPLSSEISKDNAFKNAFDETIKVYTVQKGDTLSEIAEKFGVSVNTIRWANDLGRKGFIKEGQELVILPVDGLKYKVKYGGTLRDVIKKIGGNLEEASVFNDIDPDEYLAAGTELIIPGAEKKEQNIKKVRKIVRSHGNGAPAVYKGYFMRPVKGGIRTQGVHGKNAVDIASYYGAPIYAAAPGKVILSKYGAWNGGYGNYIIVSHPNGTQTLYAHLSKNLVRRGDYVERGQVIGAMGSSGRSTGTHVHFEIRGARNPF